MSFADCQKCKGVFNNGMVDVILQRLNDRFEDVRDEARIALGLIVKYGGLVAGMSPRSSFNIGVGAPAANMNICNRLYNIVWHDVPQFDPLFHGLQQNTSVEYVDYLYLLVLVLSHLRSRGLRLFALVIGINNYQQQRIMDLKWAVHDADAVNNFLQQDLGVPENHIINLRNSEAGSKNVVEAFHRLEADTRINSGDAIFIYYAGHGMMEPLDGLKAGGNNIQVIVPSDISFDRDAIALAVPINPLLNSLSREKGNNIVRSAVTFSNYQVQYTRLMNRCGLDCCP